MPRETLPLPPTPQFDLLSPRDDAPDLDGIGDALMEYLDTSVSCSEDSEEADLVRGELRCLETLSSRSLITQDALRTALRLLWVSHLPEEDR